MVITANPDSAPKMIGFYYNVVTGWSILTMKFYWTIAVFDNNLFFVIQTRLQAKITAIPIVPHCESVGTPGTPGRDGGSVPRTR
jgi:hypothetical protein